VQVRDTIAASGGIEDFVGGRVLAWIGGLAVAVGVIFLLAIGISQGWIGEITRTLLAGVISGGLLVGGIRAHGRRGRTDAAKAATATGIVGLFATALVAGGLYHLVPAVVAIVAAIAVGATATAVAIRWRAPGIAALGILGALAAPWLLDGMIALLSIQLLFVATASATAVVVWQRWTWLGIAAFLIATPQWILFAWRVQAADTYVLPVLVGFGLLAAAAAVGFEVRARAERLRIASLLMLGVNALVLAVVGASFLDHAGLWLVALALAHLAIGVGARRTTRISHDLAMAGLVLGVVLADVGAALLLDGLPLVVGWAAGGVLFATLARVARPGLDRDAAVLGLGAHLALGLANALLVAPAGSVTGQLALIAVAASALISGRLAEEGWVGLRMALDATALVLIGYVTVASLDGVQLTLALAAEAFALIAIARRQREDIIALGGALTFTGFTVMHALVVLAPPYALYYGVDQPLAAAVGLGAAVVVVVLAARLMPEEPRVVVAVRGIAALLVLYAASVELVTPFAPQQGQALLSALWALTGVAVLIAGLVRDQALLRHVALGLLGVTVAKVFVYDLAALSSIYRVGSLIALGLLLLAGAFAWQRIRPRPLPDLRTMPGSLR
jgi:uncharacterized membrane protein